MHALIMLCFETSKSICTTSSFIYATTTVVAMTTEEVGSLKLPVDPKHWQQLQLDDILDDDNKNPPLYANQILLSLNNYE